MIRSELRSTAKKVDLVLFYSGLSRPCALGNLRLPFLSLCILWPWSVNAFSLEKSRALENTDLFDLECFWVSGVDFEAISLICFLPHITILCLIYYVHCPTFYCNVFTHLKYQGYWRSESRCYGLLAANPVDIKKKCYIKS